MVTNRQRRFLRKLYKMGLMPYSYLDEHYPDFTYDKEFGAASFQQYYERAPLKDGDGLTISCEGIIELQDFHRYLRHWLIPVILSALAIIVSMAAIAISILLPQTIRIIS